MKRIVLCVVLLAVGLVIGGSLRFNGGWQTAYQLGYRAGNAALARDAVRTGHGHWLRVGENAEFEWNMALPHYLPTAESRIPGLQ